MPDQRTVLVLQQCHDGPWCRIRDVTKIEVIAQEGVPSFTVLHKNGLKFPILGTGFHEVQIPAGSVMIRRTNGRKPITVYAWS